MLRFGLISPRIILPKIGFKFQIVGIWSYPLQPGRSLPKFVFFCRPRERFHTPTAPPPAPYVTRRRSPSFQSRPRHEHPTPREGISSVQLYEYIWFASDETYEVRRCAVIQTQGTCPRDARDEAVSAPTVAERDASRNHTPTEFRAKVEPELTLS